MSVNQSGVSWVQNYSDVSKNLPAANNSQQYVYEQRQSEQLESRLTKQQWDLALTATSVVNKEVSKFTTPFMAREDLVQEGYIGLLKAAERFNPERGVIFHTYARWWVRAQMARAISNKGRTIRIPGGALEQLRIIRDVKSELESKGQSFDYDTLSQKTGIDINRIHFLLNKEVGGFTCNDMDDNGSPVYEQYPSTRENSEQSVIKQEILKIIMDKYNDLLNDREKYVLNGYFGLDGSAPKTLSQIGKELGLSRERIRQIRLGAYKKYRSYLKKTKSI